MGYWCLTSLKEYFRTTIYIVVAVNFIGGRNIKPTENDGHTSSHRQTLPQRLHRVNSIKSENRTHSISGDEHWLNFESFTVAIIPWLFVTECLCHRWHRVCRNHNSVLWLKTGFVARVAQRVHVVGQELLTISEYVSSSAICSGVYVAQSLVFCVVLCGPVSVWLLYCLSFD